ncbi:MAG: 2-amino-4-hydroxy-6-hydroxymethyldihydropteridine diphosphokinase [Abditibacteriota bacterium]|nr:2-amino-4-hydroxy-6-hydroxymethyldihydropteridine diphosphokinase [Abditibacteriota bacterium]
MRVYIGLGSNIGDGVKQLTESAERLRKYCGASDFKMSSLYLTEPVGYVDQPDFTNAVCSFDTDLTPREVLGVCNRIEKELGRKRLVHWGPRTIDLDVLLCDDLKIDEPDLKVPHPRMLERAFVLVPLAELAPDMFDYDNLPKEGVKILRDKGPAK